MAHAWLAHACWACLVTVSRALSTRRRAHTASGAVGSPPVRQPITIAAVGRFISVVSPMSIQHPLLLSLSSLRPSPQGASSARVEDAVDSRDLRPAETLVGCRPLRLVRRQSAPTVTPPSDSAA